MARNGTGKKAMITFALAAATLGIVAASHLLQWRMYEWTRILLCIPVLYASINLRKADAFATAMLILIGISPVSIEMMKRNATWAFNLTAAGIAVVFISVYIGIMMKKLSENTKTVSQAHEILQALRKSADPGAVLDVLRDIFMSKCETDEANILLLNSDGYLCERDADTPPLPHGHLFYHILASGVFFHSPNAASDKRIAASDGAAGISHLLVFPLIVAGVPKGVIAVSGSRLERIPRELISLLAAIKTSVEHSLELIEKREKTISHEIRRRKLRDNLASYVSSKFLEKVSGGEDELSLGGDTRYVTVMFTEISNFREIAGGVDAGDLIAMLNEFFSLAIDTVFEHDGTMDKFIGHNIMAFWGAPVPLPDGEKRAVHCALDLQKKLEALNASWRADGKPEFSLSIGINSGEAVAGTIGSLRRMEYTVIGDTVNIAARIKALSGSQGIPILVGEKTRNNLGENFSFSSGFNASLKGKKSDVTVFAIESSR